VSRIVCDTNVIVSGFVSNASPRRILERVEDGQVRAFTSRELLVELECVLRYSRIDRLLVRARVPRDDIVRWVASRFTIVMPKPSPQPVVVDDPADDRVLECAVAAGADVVVSGDAHLLNLGTCHGIRIVRASEYLVM
jgi:putative PIN family toxin of toxin-antitoxin system